MWREGPAGHREGRPGPASRAAEAHGARTGWPAMVPRRPGLGRVGPAGPCFSRGIQWGPGRAGAELRGWRGRSRAGVHTCERPPSASQRGHARAPARRGGVRATSGGGAHCGFMVTIRWSPCGSVCSTLLSLSAGSCVFSLWTVGSSLRLLNSSLLSGGGFAVSLCVVPVLVKSDPSVT